MSQYSKKGHAEGCPFLQYCDMDMLPAGFAEPALIVRLRRFPLIDSCVFERDAWFFVLRMVPHMSGERWRVVVLCADMCFV